jgi:hypothetical protein
MRAERRALSAPPLRFLSRLKFERPRHPPPHRTTHPMEPALATLRRAAAPRRQTRCSLYQCLYLHTTAAQRLATPLPTPSVPGPPPDAPTPQSEAHDRVARKRKQAELLRQAREVRPSPSTKPNSIFRKRFWKDVTVKESEGACRSKPCHGLR